MARWRNGRRGGLKIPCPKGRVGSTPTRATMIVNKQTIFNNKIDVKNSSNSISLNTCLLSNLLNNKTNGREMAGSNPVEKVKVHPSIGKEIKSPINKNLWVFLQFGELPEWSNGAAC